MGASRINTTIVATVLLTVIMPVVIGRLLNTYVPTTFTSIPLHSVVETTGGIIAINISALIYMKYRSALVMTHYNWSTTALLAMGIIDIFHASVMPGGLFVWLHSIAVLFGGIFFVNVWFRERRVAPACYYLTPLIFIIFSVGVSVLSIMYASHLPPMLDAQGHFTPLANAFNIIGGVGFFAAGVKFLLRYANRGTREDILLAGHTLLFGIAGALFVSSRIWDMQWWLWHMLRLAAYAIAFYFLYVEFRRGVEEVERTNEVLTEKNEEIATYLDIIDSHVITSSTDTKGVITQVSSAFCKISGYRAEELIGRPHSIVRHPDTPQVLFEELWECIRSGREWHGELQNLKKNGEPYWVDTVIRPQYDEGGAIKGYMSVRSDVTDRKNVELLSVTDALTGLYNRRYFNEAIEREISRARREEAYVGFMVLDVDDFKRYNDNYGHQKGDTALKELGKLLDGSIKRAGDYAFRLGGEEFGLLYSGPGDAAMLAYAESIRKGIEALRIEHAYNSGSPYLSVSIGLVVQKGGQIQSSDELYRLADEALYRAKELGRNRVVTAETAVS